VRYTINHLQKIFKLRNCEDTTLANRSRPCLQYQIKRCTAPCVGKVDEEQYRAQIRQAELFLKGRNDQLIADQARLMEQASERLEFEIAATHRDTIEQLRRINQQQFVTGFNGNLDIIACVVEQDYACIQVFMVRGGTSLGNKPFFVRRKLDNPASELIEAFVVQHYSRHPVPDEVIVSERLENATLIERNLCASAKRQVRLKQQVRDLRKRALEMALRNARESLTRHLQSASNLNRRYQALVEALDLAEAPRRMECFDISHTQGEATKASCVVFGQEGPIKAEYRLYNIREITAGDDYAAMRQVLSRRYDKLRQAPQNLPDLIFIDGGKGQLSSALEIIQGFDLFSLNPEMRVLGIAKGPERRAGYEDIIDEDFNTLEIPLNSPALLLIQQIRDEAHRFAITGHRKARGKVRNASRLEEIPGIGARRRQQLLQAFGGLQGVKAAGVEELMKIRGINRETAQAIYDTFHG
jgi:excinuclease ABC subunit C